MTLERDRDEAGRPKNARPRDGLGRPLARGAVGEPVTPDDLRLPPGEALLTAQRLIDAGRPFHAHEVLEAVWKSAPAGQRTVWKGLAQIAVGLTHARRGNSTGAEALLRRGAEAVAAYVTGDTGGHACAAGQSGGHAGAVRQTGRQADTSGLANMAGQGGSLPDSIDLAGARRAALDLADRIAQSGLGSLDDADLRVPLAAGH